MLATSWVQIIKAVLMLTCGIVLTVWVLSRIGWNPIDLFRDARAKSSDGAAYLKPGLFLSTPLDTVSLGLGAGARHGRAAAHPDAVLHGARPPRRPAAR